MSQIPVTPRTKLSRLPARGSHEREVINQILDEAFICHVGFVADGQPFVIPTGFGRKDDHLYIHGSAASRMLKNLAAGVPMCVTVTLLDGLVMARSMFHHSMNYRSVVVLGTATPVTEREEKIAALHIISDHIVRGRWNEVRELNDNELKQTAVLKLPIEEASAKVRTGPPKDEAEDYDLPIWAGVLPIAMKLGEPVPDPALRVQAEVPGSVRKYAR